MYYPVHLPSACGAGCGFSDCCVGDEAEQLMRGWRSSTGGGSASKCWRGVVCLRRDCGMVTWPSVGWHARARPFRVRPVGHLPPRPTPSLRRPPTSEIDQPFIAVIIWLVIINFLTAVLHTLSSFVVCRLTFNHSLNAPGLILKTFIFCTSMVLIMTFAQYTRGSRDKFHKQDRHVYYPSACGAGCGFSDGCVNVPGWTITLTATKWLRWP